LRYVAKLIRDPFERFCLCLQLRNRNGLLLGRRLRGSEKRFLLALSTVACLVTAIFCLSRGRLTEALLFTFALPSAFAIMAGDPRVLCETPTGKLAAVTANPLVREYAQGASQGAMEQLAVASFLAPIAPTAGLIGRYKRYNQKHRFRLPKTRRVLGGPATQIGFTADDALFQANANALDFPVDNLEKLEGDDLINVVNEASDMVAEVAALSWESEVVNKATETLGEGTDAVFSADVDPIKFLDLKILDVLKAAKSGSMMSIRLLFGATAWLTFKNHAKVTGKFTNNQRGATSPQVTLEMATDLLLTKPEILTTYSVYDTAKEGLAPAISFLLDSKIILFACKKTPTRLDPSFMKTFAPRGQFMVPGTYPLQDQRGEVVKYDWNCVAEVTNDEAGILLNVSES